MLFSTPMALPWPWPGVSPALYNKPLNILPAQPDKAVFVFIAFIKRMNNVKESVTVRCAKPLKFLFLCHDDVEINEYYDKIKSCTCTINKHAQFVLVVCHILLVYLH